MRRHRSAFGLVLMILVLGLLVCAVGPAPADELGNPASDPGLSGPRMPDSSSRIDPDYNYGPGPLQIASQSPAQSFRLTMPPVVPGTIPLGGPSVRIAATWTNVWAKDFRYLLDYEMLETRVTVSYGVTNRFGLAIAFDQRDYFGGAMDNLIEKFHDFLGLPQNGRKDFDHNLTQIVLRDDQGKITSVIDDLDGLDNNGISFITHYVLHHGTTLSPAIGLTGIVRYGLNTTSGDDDDEPLDLGIGVGLSKRWADRWYSYGQLSYTRYGQTNLLGLELKNHAFSGMVAMAWQWKPNISILGQYLFHEGVSEHFGDLSNFSHEVNLGFKWALGRFGLLEFGIIENIIEHDNSPDLGFHGAYEYRF